MTNAVPTVTTQVELPLGLMRAPRADDPADAEVLMPMPVALPIPALDSRIANLAVAIPCYTNVSTHFLQNILPLVRRFPMGIDLASTRAVYLVEAMRYMLGELWDKPDWERLLIIEQDMILPDFALVRHAQHTADIVGSTYFIHREPHNANCLYADPASGKMGFPQPELTAWMLANPGLWPCDSVGFGCTSISRRVFTEWDANIPMFRTERDGTREIGHDLYFCRQAARQGFKIFVDSTVVCGHLTERPLGVAEFARVNNLPLEETVS